MSRLIKCVYCGLHHSDVSMIKACAMQKHSVHTSTNVPPVHMVRTWVDDRGTHWCGITFANRLLAMEYARTHRGNYRYHNKRGTQQVVLMWRATTKV